MLEGAVLITCDNCGVVLDFNAEGFLSMLAIFLAVFCLLDSVFLGSILLDIVGGGPGVQISVQEGTEIVLAAEIVHGMGKELKRQIEKPS